MQKEGISFFSWAGIWMEYMEFQQLFWPRGSPSGWNYIWWNRKIEETEILQILGQQGILYPDLLYVKEISLFLDLTCYLGFQSHEAYPNSTWCNDHVSLTISGKYTCSTVLRKGQDGKVTWHKERELHLQPKPGSITTVWFWANCLNITARFLICKIELATTNS